MNRLAQEKKVCALIPARLNSVRFPGKALKQIDGIPMVVRVLAAARNSGVFDAVYAATDSPEIAAVCQTYGFEAVFTSHSHQNPTSRIQEAVTILEVRIPARSTLLCGKPRRAPGLLVSVFNFGVN